MNDSISFGMGAALFGSLSYVCIRLFNKRPDDNVSAVLSCLAACEMVKNNLRRQYYLL
jgi:hypothetical protein